MTPTEIDDFARQQYNSVGDTFWSEAELRSLMYQAQMELATKALVIEGAPDTSVPTVIGQRAYTLPSLVIAIKRIEYNGIKLDPIDFQEDDTLTLSSANTTSTGTPLYYALWNNKVYLRPVPDAVQTLTIYAYKEPTQTTTVTTELDVPTMYHLNIVDFLLKTMCAKDGNMVSAKYYEERWDKAVLEAIKWQRKRRRGDSFVTVKNDETMARTIIGLT